MKKLQAQVAQLEADLNRAELTILKLKTKLESNDTMVELKVEMKGLEVERRMKKEVEEAFIRGMSHCKQTMMDLKELQG